MNFVNTVLNPLMMSFVTTNKCTASCNNCCFDCGPQREDRLQAHEMISYIDQATSTYPSIKLLVISGGECFTLGKDLNAVVKHGAIKGLIVRIVTNSYWAKSFKVAYLKLFDLKRAGLKELNISTGDEHQEFIPYEYIVNSIIASIKLSLEIVVNVESSSISKFSAKDIYSDYRIKKYSTHPQLKIVNGSWIAFKKSTAELRKIEEESSKTNAFSTILTQKRCDGLFNSINIDCYHQLNACCGLTLNYIPYLKLGELKNNSIKKLYEQQFNDFLKIWLFVDGPKKILQYCLKKRGLGVEIENVHLCQMCIEVFKEDNINVIKNNITNLQTDVFLKFNILHKKNNY